MNQRNRPCKQEWSWWCLSHCVCVWLILFKTSSAFQLDLLTLRTKHWNLFCAMWIFFIVVVTVIVVRFLLFHSFWTVSYHTSLFTIHFSTIYINIHTHISNVFCAWTQPIEFWIMKSSHSLSLALLFSSHSISARRNIQKRKYKIQMLNGMPIWIP